MDIRVIGLGNVLMGDDGDDVLNGGAGNDQAYYAGAGAGVTVDLASGTATGGPGSS